MVALCLHVARWWIQLNSINSKESKMKIYTFILIQLVYISYVSAQHDMHNMNREVENKNQIVEEDLVPVKINMHPGKTVVYHLYVTDTIVNFAGKSKRAIAINGSIPAPTLIFTEGDTAEIYLHNMLKSEETSLHWHGVILPNHADGVPYLTTKRIGPGETHLYKFAVVKWNILVSFT